MVVFCGQSKHKLALRNLSMVMRQVGGDTTERQSNIEESVTLAKNAVQLDVTDGTSWCEYHSCRHLFLLLQQLCTVGHVILRSTGCRQLFIPRHRRSMFGHRAFSVAGSSAWNSLPDYLRDLSHSADSCSLRPENFSFLVLLLYTVH